MQTPVQNQQEAIAHQTFLALMWALSHPGRIQAGVSTVVSSQETFIAIGEALLDLETTFYTPDTQDSTLSRLLSRTKARPTSAAVARYHFYESLDDKALMGIEMAPVGDMLYPDRGATLVINCTLGDANEGKGFTFSGPGIQTTHHIQIGGLPDRFWEIRESRLNYPLGWDIFLVDGGQIVGIPRTTVVSVQ